MTEKRFSSRFYEDTGRTITDNNEELSQNEVVDLLNELHEENIMLKESIERFIHENDILRTQLGVDL